ncbi:MAG: AMP-binding protein [Gammaproteobacteria bacterium]|nr:AMP-binding protein [Gammaproteobacteria bacterium]
MTASLYTHLVSGALFPLHERLKGHTSVAKRRALEQSQWWPTERILAAQQQKLAAFMARIARDVPYYAKVFRDAGLAPDAIRTPADLARLPFLTKADIRAHGEDLRAAGAAPLRRLNTGGSSGEPLVFFVGPERISHDVAAKWRATRWWGVDIGDPEIVLWGSPIEVNAQDRVRALRDAVLRTRLLPAFDLSPDSIDGFLDTIASVRPPMLFGYPSAFALMARQAEASGRDLSGLGIRVAFVTSERLYDDQRQVIERVFGCPVANGYGGRDAGFIAHQCPAGGMHVMAEDIVLEVIDPDGRPLPPGHSGELVVTHLATGDYPFVRYRTGDVGVLGTAPCPCGRGLPLLERIEGRTTDFIVAQDGTPMHGLALIYVVRDLPHVESFKIVQESRERVEVFIVPGPGYSHDTARPIQEGFRARLGQGVEVQVTVVEDIPREKSGKFRYVVSHAQ